MTTQIPRYGLYGETAHGEDLDPVHCQALFSNIERHTGQSEPHRHEGLHQFVILMSGEIEASIDETSLALTGPVVASIPTECVHGFGYAPDAAGRIVTVTAPLLSTLINNSPFPSTYSWLQQACLIPLTSQKAAETRQTQHYLDLIEQELVHRDVGALDAIASALKLLLVSFARAHTKHERTQSSELRSHYQIISQRFQSLAASHYRDHWDIQKYCLELAVTAKQLSRICHTQFGQPPMSYLHDLLNREAQRRLIYTNATATEIGYELGFKDPAYFSRFFRRMNEASPTEYLEAKRKPLTKAAAI